MEKLNTKNCIMQTQEFLKSIFLMASDLIQEKKGLDDNLRKNLNESKEKLILFVKESFAEQLIRDTAAISNNLKEKEGKIIAEIEAAFEEFIGENE